jgi:MFS transporter, PPP family, 3-phenylpropionic acid transporter
VPAATRLSLFYAAFFLAGGVQLPFWPVWLSSRGLGPGEIGALLAIGQWTKVAATPLIGGMADRSCDPRRVMLGLVILCLAGYVLCIPARGFLPLTFLNALTAACLAGLLPIGESLALSHTRQGAVDYGRVRLWGTLAFVLATLAGGPIVGGRNPDIILALILGLTALNLGSCSLLPRAHTHLSEETGSWRQMMAGQHLLFLACATLIAASHSVYYAFGTLNWQAQGHSDTVIAMLWAEGAAAEAVFFFWGARAVARWGPTALLAVGGGSAALRWTVLAVASDLRVLALAQLLHAGTLAAAHLGAMHYMARAVPPRYAATGQAVYSAVVGGAGYGLFMLASGWLYGALGGEAYLAMAALGIAALVLALLLGRSTRVTNS